MNSVFSAKIQSKQITFIRCFAGWVDGKNVGCVQIGWQGLPGDGTTQKQKWLYWYCSLVVLGEKPINRYGKPIYSDTVDIYDVGG